MQVELLMVQLNLQLKETLNCCFKNKIATINLALSQLASNKIATSLQIKVSLKQIQRNTIKDKLTSIIPMVGKPGKSNNLEKRQIFIQKLLNSILNTLKQFLIEDLPSINLEKLIKPFKITEELLEFNLRTLFAIITLE